MAGPPVDGGGKGGFDDFFSRQRVVCSKSSTFQKEYDTKDENNGLITTIITNNSSSLPNSGIAAKIKARQVWKFPNDYLVFLRYTNRVKMRKSYTGGPAPQEYILVVDVATFDDLFGRAEFVANNSYKRANDLITRWDEKNSSPGQVGRREHLDFVYQLKTQSWLNPRERIKDTTVLNYILSTFASTQAVANAEGVRYMELSGITAQIKYLSTVNARLNRVLVETGESHPDGGPARGDGGDLMAYDHLGFSCPLDSFVKYLRSAAFREILAHCRHLIRTDFGKSDTQFSVAAATATSGYEESELPTAKRTRVNEAAPPPPQQPPPQPPQPPQQTASEEDDDEEEAEEVEEEEVAGDREVPHLQKAVFPESNPEENPFDDDDDDVYATYDSDPPPAAETEAKRGDNTDGRGGE